MSNKKTHAAHQKTRNGAHTNGAPLGNDSAPKGVSHSAAEAHPLKVRFGTAAFDIRKWEARVCLLTVNANDSSEADIVEAFRTIEDLSDCVHRSPLHHHSEHTYDDDHHHGHLTIKVETDE